MDNEPNDLTPTQPEISQLKRSFTPKFLALIGVLVITGGVTYGYATYLAWSNLKEANRIAEEGQKQIQELQQKRAVQGSPSAGSTSSPQVSSGQFDVPSNWQIYRNEEYGFEFRYPGDWELTTTFNSVGLVDKNYVYIGPGEGRRDSQFYFYFSSLKDYLKNGDIYNKKTISLKAHLDAYSQVEDAYGVEYKTIEFQGKSGYLVSVGGMDSGYDIVFENIANVYTIELPGSADSSGKFSLSDVEYQILSTFKFIDKTLEGQFCGGIAGITCPSGYGCKLDGDYPDAGGVCVVE